MKAANKINTGVNIPSTMNANETTEFSELTHAGQCLDIYLHNTAEIYERYTVPAIEACVKAQSVKTPEMWDYIKQALKAASRLVVKFDGMTPTADDIKAVTANYVAYSAAASRSEGRRHCRRKDLSRHKRPRPTAAIRQNQGGACRFH